MSLDHQYYMGVALGLARQAGDDGNRPIGSLVVSPDGEIVGHGTNRVFTDFDSTAHGETLAIRDASQRLKIVDLAGYTLYSSHEPCPMCCWAILQANLAQLVIGCRHAALGSPGLGRYSVETLLELTGRSIDLVTGVRAAEAEAMRRAWNAERGL